MALSPDTRCSIVIDKQFTYRGATRIFSNRYHFEGDLPSDEAAWEELSDAIVTAEKPIYPATVEIVGATGYDFHSASPTNPHGDAVYTKTYAQDGTGDFTAGGTESPGDCAAFLRYSTPARSVKNHPVYLSNYFHGIYQQTGTPDNLNTLQKTAIEDYAAAWLTGFPADGSNRERCGPRGAVATAYRVDPFVRHRDFPA